MSEELSIDEYTGFWTEIQEQPPWRTKADREADYIDGNQLDAEILQRMADIGIPPAIEPLMGPGTGIGPWHGSAESRGLDRAAAVAGRQLGCGRRAEFQTAPGGTAVKSGMSRAQRRSRHRSASE